MNLPQNQEAGETVDFAEGVRQLLAATHLEMLRSRRRQTQQGGGKLQVSESSGARQLPGHPTRAVPTQSTSISGAVPVPGPVFNPGPGVRLAWPYLLEFSLGHLGPDPAGGVSMHGGSDEFLNGTTWYKRQFTDLHRSVERVSGGMAERGSEGIEELHTPCPLQHLRLDTGTSTVATRWPRTRLTSLLSQAVPDNVKSEAAATRKLSATHLLLHLVHQDPTGRTGGEGQLDPIPHGAEDFELHGGDGTFVTLAEMVRLQQRRRRQRTWVEAKGDCRLWLSGKGVVEETGASSSTPTAARRRLNWRFFCSGLNHTRRECPHVRKSLRRVKVIVIIKSEVDFRTGLFAGACRRRVHHVKLAMENLIEQKRARPPLAVRQCSNIRSQARRVGVD